MTQPIQYYGLATPNGQKVSIALEEMELPYEFNLINIGAGDQFSEEYKKINPNSKIPSIVDPEGPNGEPISVFESGAILIYLAEKSGKFLSTDPVHRIETIQWLMFQMGGLGPMFGQFGHFFKYGGSKLEDPYSVDRYRNESKRLLGVLDTRLEGRDFIVDSGYSIADITSIPWITAAREFYDATDALELDSFKNVMSWYERCTSRPGAQRGRQVGAW
ncbi:MAG: glutathione S-transferase N-terminal domain-containing protein [Chloroflexota bacterium]